MATLPTYFRDFLKEIRPTENQRKEMKTGHETLRERLNADEDLKEILVSDFLQGSYRRSTAIRPVADSRSDVDVVVVTNLDAKTTTPQEAMDRFEPFLEKHYKGKWKFKGRSMGIELSYVELDLVVTAAPSEVDQVALRSSAARASDTPEDVTDWVLNPLWISLEERQRRGGAFGQLTRAAETPTWKTEPLLIPDRDAGEWVETHPLAQIEWTFAKNADTERHFVNVTKALKWWRRVKHEKPERPKSYPLEHIIGDCCPAGITSVAEGVVRTLEEIRDRYRLNAQLKTTPYLGDRGVEQNVLKRQDGGHFAEFHDQSSSAADLARQAFEEEATNESARLWRELFGPKFPEPPESNGPGGGGGQEGYSPRSELSVPPRTRFARHA